MTYYIFAGVIAITALGGALSVLFVKKRKAALTLSVITVFLAVLGVVLSLVSALLLKGDLSSPTLSDEFVSWARDTFSSYHKGVCLVSGTVLVISLLSFFIRPAQRYVRAALIFLSVAAILTATPVFAFLSNDSAVNLARYIKMSGLGISLITLFPLFADHYALSRSHAEENGK